MRPNLVFDRINYISMAETMSEYRRMADVFSRMVRGETGVGEYNYRGVSWICAFRPIQGTGGWSLGAACPVAESPLSRVTFTFLITGTVFLGLGILIAFFAAGFISHPFERMAQFALMAKSASDAKSNFLANVSREMRPPLNAIIGFAELELGREKEGAAKSATSESFEKIYRTGVTLLGLMNHILHISKIEAGKFELAPVNYDMPGLINDTVVLNRVRIGSKPVIFKLDIEENLPARLFGDELRIKQILNNLLSNAFKYPKEGSVTLKIRCERGGEGVWMTCSVRDTGMGIREEDIGRLFSDYSRADTRSSHHIEGTGLGLAITDRMVRMMNGSIRVESVYGRGSVFTVRILQGFAGDDVLGKERAADLMEFRYTLARKDRNRQMVRAQLPCARVLVVDDVPVNLDLAREIMKPYGMIVDCAASGQAAIDLIRRGEPRYNAIFMDHMMPGMDGIEAARIIRNEIGSEYAQTVPIIAFTADAIIGNEKMFMNNGFQDFLTKPIDIMKMDEAINRWVRNRKLEKDPGLDTGSRIAESAGDDALGEEDAGMRKSLARMIQAIPVEGLDVEEALERFCGDGKAYMDSLYSYLTHTPVLLGAARSVDSLTDYAITVHGIKGSSYGISAQTIGQRAEKLEHAAKAGDRAFIEAENDRFIEAAGKFMAELKKLLDTLEEKVKARMPGFILGASPRCGDRAIRSNSSACLRQACGICASIPCAFLLLDTDGTQPEVQPKRHPQSGSVPNSGLVQEPLGSRSGSAEFAPQGGKFSIFLGKWVRKLRFPYPLS
jgi:signal transduction histidine kinase/AmiR/NasT family two-component response regulator/HPt (histidine-containing phosphotransfer) domain-containing protein